MFEETIKNLNKELEDLRAKHNKCYELMENVQDKEKKGKLAAQHYILGNAIDRAAICLTILSDQVPMEVSGDFLTVKFTLPNSLPKGKVEPGQKLLL
ncbi:MAG: hypothetical protein ABSG90_13370 [Dehalococcoidia bacterium]|jgi:hypothetical protein